MTVTRTTLLLAIPLLLSATPARALEDIARRIADAAPELATLWPGFWSGDAPFLLYRRDGHCVLVSAAPPDADFSQARGDARLWRGRCEGARFRPDFLLDQSFGGIDAPAVRVGRRDTAAVADVLLHEAFHTYQARHFARRNGSRLRFDFPVRRDLVELKLHETVLLIGALEAEQPTQRAERVRMALALRQERLQAMEPEAAEVEDHFMRTEGSAEWVGMEARRTMQRIPDESAVQRARWRALERSAGATWERLLRWQSYLTGATAFALLHADGHDWQAALAAGSAPWALLESAYGAPWADTQLALQQAERINRWARIRRHSAALVRAQRRSDQALARFERHRGFRLELNGPPSSFDIAFSAHDMHSLRDGMLIVDPNPMVVEAQWLRLDARRSPVRIADQGARIILQLRGRPAVEACPGNGERVCPAGTVLRSRDIEIRLAQPAWLQEESRTIRLRAAEPHQAEQEPLR
ncbi:MAG TPA: hypothetical protein PKZ76_10170 [Xanthomonadaceae bacterium]|nr:hypothetical protein [Xanthomonadaceae bacterium]